MGYAFLSHDVASVSDIMPCNKIDKPLVAYILQETLWNILT